MRIDIKKTSVYSFDELSDDAKQVAIEQFYSINIERDWWNIMFEDAANIGIRITEFDISRGSYCHGEIDNPEHTARLILKGHGKECETYKTAKAYLDSIPRNENATGDDYKDIDNEFRLSILEDYRIMLQKDYEYQTSAEAITETIECNEYEFTVDGKLYQ